MRLPRPLTQRRVVDRRRDDGDQQPRRARGSASPPRAGASAGRSSRQGLRQGLVGADHGDRHLELRQRVADARGSAGARPRRPPRRRAARTRRWSSSTTTVPIPRVRSVASGRTNDGSCEAVMTIAVMPRRSRLTPVTQGLGERRPAVGLDRREQLEDLEPLAGAAVGRQDRQPVAAGGHARRRGSRRAPCRRSTPRRGRATSVVDRSPLARLDGRVEVEEDPGVGRLLEVELLDLDLARSARSSASGCGSSSRPARTAGRSSRAASSGACAPAWRGRPRCWPVAGATAAARRRAGRRPASRPARPPADASKNPNGSPVRIMQRLDPEVAAPHERRAHEPRALLAAAQRAARGRAARRGASSGCGPRATASGSRPVLRSV